MGRKPRFDVDEILDAARSLAIESDPASVSMTAVAERIGAPSGSLYHRFSSRDEMMARLWLRTIVRYQQGISNAIENARLDDVPSTVVSYWFDWTADHPEDAALLVSYDAADLVARWPDDIGAELKERNRASRRLLNDYAIGRFGTDRPDVMDRVSYALVDLPYAAVRRHLPGGIPAPWLRAFTLRAAEDLLRDVDVS